jgi:HlyD family secretion protein
MTEMMENQVDLRELAVDRSEPVARRVLPGRHLWTRYVVPGVLVAGFLGLLVWAAWDLVFPPHKVSVVPVFATTAELRQAGTPLFQAAGWIEPRPTPVRVAALAPGVVVELLVVEDQVVRAGEPIALLVEEDARLAHRRSVSELALREADHDAANAILLAAEVRHQQPVHLDAVLGEAEASLARIDTQVRNLPFLIRRAEADYQATRKDYRRKLEVKEIIASVEIDLAQGRLDSALALLEGLRDRESSLERERAALLLRRDALGTQRKLLTNEIREKQVAASKVKVAAARIERARVAVAEAKLRLDRMTVRSPIDGRVFRLIAHPGAQMGDSMTQMLGRDGRTVVTLYRPEMLQVRVDVRFEDIPKVLPNQPVVIEKPGACLLARRNGSVYQFRSGYPKKYAAGQGGDHRSPTRVQARDAGGCDVPGPAAGSCRSRTAVGGSQTLCLAGLDSQGRPGRVCVGGRSLESACAESKGPNRRIWTWWSGCDYSGSQ